jgi:hypothetical protein
MLFAYWIWKYARHGDGTPGKKQAVNAAYDMRYPAYVAICDGLLACDAEVLNMTWACWPAKRAGIYTYDKAKGGVVPYRPSWEAQGAETAG